MASEVAICNRALQKLGAQRIVSLDEDTKNARESATAYPLLRDAELRAHPWSFAIRRRQLAADADQPVFADGQTAFVLPTDFLKLLADREVRDRQVEGRRVLTARRSEQLDIRYVARITDPNTFDPLFVEALACRIAMELNERITQSNTKKQLLFQDYDRALDEARRANALDRPPVTPVASPWVRARVADSGGPA